MMTQLRINIKIILTNANKLDSPVKRKAFSNWITKYNQQNQKQIYLTQCDSERLKIE